MFAPLSRDLIPSACRLSTQAGWNQTLGDWERLSRLDSGVVRVWVDDGEVRAGYSVVGFGQVAWIGMILVDQAYRGKGLGTMVFEAAVKEAMLCPDRVLGLDATALGEPLYRKAGFQSIRPIVRWRGHSLLGDLEARSLDFRHGLSQGIIELDLQSTGADRSSLIKDLASVDTVVSLEKEGRTVAFAATRPGRTAVHIGPVVAYELENFSRIFRYAMIASRGREVICDLLNEQAADVLAGFGLKPSRYLERMTSPRREDCLCGPNVWCGAGLELG